MQADQNAQPELSQRLSQTERYLEVDPGNTDLLAMAIDLSLALGNVECASHHAGVACARYPSDPFFQYRRAHVLAAQSDLAAAETQFASLLQAHPDVNIAYSLADCQMRLGRYQDALNSMEPYRTSTDLSAEAATLLVRVLHHLGEFDAAQALVAAQRERLAAEPVFLAAASLMLLDLGDVAGAADLSATALNAGARPLEAMVVSATLALGADDADTAIARFTEVLAINPQEGRSWSGLGLASLLRRDLAAASVQLEQAVKFLPKHIGSWHALGWCRLFSQNLDGAAQAFQTALDLDRNFGESHGAMAVILAARNERDAAAGAIERALRLDPQGLTARYAQMMLNGDATDPARFRAIAYRLLAGRRTVGGADMAAVLKRHADT